MYILIKMQILRVGYYKKKLIININKKAYANRNLEANKWIQWLL